MRKIYRYTNLSYSVADETDVYLTVKFISDGNSGLTTINVPGDLDPEFENEKKVFIGKGKDLRTERTVCISNIDNLNPDEDEVLIHYLINDELIQEHRNPKSDEESPMIILKINFPKP